MRFLNKIVLINSASVSYAEVDLEGNAHFIGTQGVGKSTIQRAILFFYNVDKLKLGIKKQQKTFDDFYFPYQNSYIIYEVKRETGPFSILAFKSLGRVAFRFFDSDYHKEHFIDSQGIAMEWNKIREAFGKDVPHTKIIHGYEEYRNILYGNNHGLKAEFRKYAILESKQFHNIPRTIQNVFLNSDLSAEFIKETIINSMNEDEIGIDLTTYSQSHLKDFETNLQDIQKWTEKNRNGEARLQKQAESIAKYHSALDHLEREKKQLAHQLGWALNNIEEKQPKVLDNLRDKEQRKEKLGKKAKGLNDSFEKKQAQTQKEIGKLQGKLDETKTKRQEYEAIGIEGLIKRVEQKIPVEQEKDSLIAEKNILTSQFSEIKQRYEALLNQLKNQLQEFQNSKAQAKNKAQASNLEFQQKLSKQYDLIYEEIRKQHKEELKVANNLLEEKKSAINKCKVKKAEIRNKHFYATEIEKCQTEELRLNKVIDSSSVEVERAGEKMSAIKNEWGLLEKEAKSNTERKIEKQNDIKSEFKKEIDAIGWKIENSNDSLYGWLNEQLPGWEKTIGKVIDEESVLFKRGLNPAKAIAVDANFYGIHLDLTEIEKSVKTITDYKLEQDNLKNEVQTTDQTIVQLQASLTEETQKLTKKFRALLREQKEIVQNAEYVIEQSKLKVDANMVQLNEYKGKAKKEKSFALEEIEKEIAQNSEEEIKASEEVEKIKASVERKIKLKYREKDKLILEEGKKLNATIENIDAEIKEFKAGLAIKESELKSKQKHELDDKGADTERIGAIDDKIRMLNTELSFIEENQTKVIEYRKDKRELFEKETEFKSGKVHLEKQLSSALGKHNQQRKKLNDEIEGITSEIKEIEAILGAYASDLKEYQIFKLTPVFEAIRAVISEFSDDAQNDNRCKSLIDSINQNHYSAKDRYAELQEAINKFTGNFQENNIFSFKTKLIERNDYFEFAELLKEFIDEDKISEYKKRVEERFAHIIRQIGKETGELIAREGEIHGVTAEINKDFVARNFVGAVKSMELRTVPSANRVFQLLVEIMKFNDDHAIELGSPNLFSAQSGASKNAKAISLLKQLIKEMATYKNKEIHLADSFELQFRIVENDNDSGWVEKLTNVGSDGTDVLVKAMINIMLLNVFKEKATKKQRAEFRLHCMMDEIGKLHPTNIKGILKFANDRNILLVNSSPTSYNATDYRYTYLLSKDSKNVTLVKRLVRKLPKPNLPASNEKTENGPTTQ